MADSIESVIYSEAQRALALQPVLVNELRARTGILLAVTTATTSFLGAIVVNKVGLCRFGVLAIAAFVVAVACCGAVLSPHRKWTFSESPALLIRTLCESKRPDRDAAWTVSEAQREIALWMEKHTNQAIASMATMQKLYLGAGASFAIEVACWLIAYAD